MSIAALMSGTVKQSSRCSAWLQSAGDRPGMSVVGTEDANGQLHLLKQANTAVYQGLFEARTCIDVAV